jgi:hypothetical protein
VRRYERTQIGHVVIWSLLPITLIANGGLIGSWSHCRPSLIVSIILLVALLLFYKLRITIEDQTLCAVFGIGIIRKSMPLAEIVACEPIRIRWWYGWGIHLTPSGWLYNVSGFDVVAITLCDGRNFALGNPALRPRVRVAHASRVLVSASRRNNLSLRVRKMKVRDDETSSPARETRALPYWSSRNQRSAIDVCASLTSWLPWNVPIRTR